MEIAPGLEPGVVHVEIKGTWLYLALADGLARRYKIAVGAAGRNFRGEARMGRMAEWPSWTPTANRSARSRRSTRSSRAVCRGGTPRAPWARAPYLHQGGRDTMCRIHGTPQPWTIGGGFSSGCLRMANEHATDLYDRVPVGTRVSVA